MIPERPETFRSRFDWKALRFGPIRTLAVTPGGDRRSRPRPLELNVPHTGCSAELRLGYPHRRDRSCPRP
ncbi:protein of unknown function [Streptomyces sp. KY75]|nr:protein of unknown function [Streptomyces sp. KY75]